MSFAQAVRCGNMLHISGTASLDGQFTPLHVGNMEGQLREVYNAIGETLRAFGANFSCVVREVMYVTSMSGLVDALAARKEYYGDGPFPASTAVEVKQLLLPELLIEIQVDAALGNAAAPSKAGAL